MPECYIRGSTIKYLRIPDEIIDMVKEEVLSKGRGRGGSQQNKQQGKGRGGPGRGEQNYLLFVSSDKCAAQTFHSWISWLILLLEEIRCRSLNMWWSFDLQVCLAAAAEGCPVLGGASSHRPIRKQANLREWRTSTDPSSPFTELFLMHSTQKLCWLYRFFFICLIFRNFCQSVEEYPSVVLWTT